MRIKNSIFIVILLVGSGLLGLLSSIYFHRTSPILSSSNHIQVIETFHYPTLFVKQIEGDPHAGEKIYKQFCAACHSPHPEIDIAAPHKGDVKAWKQRRQVGIDALLKMTIQGMGAMPARGGCFECSDQQLREAILFLYN